MVGIDLVLSNSGRNDSVSILGHLSIGNSGSPVGHSLLPLFPPTFWGTLPPGPSKDDRTKLHHPAYFLCTISIHTGKKST